VGRVALLIPSFTLMFLLVAFCFYNLSSIVNGLVYYDQFGALTTLHLCLVILGIFVLLGGVWAVSVTSGEGGGVEPGTWHEGGEAMMNEQDVTLSPELPGYHSRDVSAPTSPTGPSGAPLSPGTVTSLSPSRSKRSRRQRYGSLLGAEGPPSSLSGLSIGLSPVSPGFALRPTRRRPSNNGLAAVVNEMGMRRTVSEADIGSEEPSRGARARWKWLRRVWRRSVAEEQPQS
jgi:magnesium transporter